MVWFVLAFHRGGFLFLINEHHEINPWSGCTEFQFGLSCWFAVRMKISTECLFLGFLLLGCFNICDCLICYGSPYKVYTSYLLPLVRLHHVCFHCAVSPFCKLTCFMKFLQPAQTVLKLRCFSTDCMTLFAASSLHSANSISLLHKISTSQPNTGW